MNLAIHAGIVPASGYGGGGGAGGSAPAIDSPLPLVSFASGTGTVDATSVVCSTGTWLNTPASYTFQWRRDLVDIGGATGTDYSFVTADIEADISCVVTAINAGGSTPQASDNSIHCTPTVPINSVAPALNTSSTPEGIVTCGTGTWSYTEYFTYQWYDTNGILSGNTSNSLNTSGMAGSTVYCVVTAVNNTGSAFESSNTCEVVALVVSTAAPVISGADYNVGTFWSCTTGDWSQVVGGYEYQWYRGAALISGATGTSYELAAADIVTTIYCRVTAITESNGSASQDSNITGPIPVATTNPALIDPYNYPGTTLTTSDGVWNYGGSITYQWYDDAVAVSGEVASTFIASTAGHTYYCEVTNTNAYGSTFANSDSITIAAQQPPVNTVAPVISGDSTYANITWTVTNNGTWTGGVDAYTYYWSANGSSVGGNTDSFTPDASLIGTVIQCDVVASNIAGSGSPASSNTYTVTGAAPSPTTASVITDMGSGFFEYTTAGTSSGDPTPTISSASWIINGVSVGSATLAGQIDASSYTGQTIIVQESHSNVVGSITIDSNSSTVP